MPSRPCKYCLALQDDSVFADFEINNNGCLYLVRISFDSYGCCKPETNFGEIDVVNSKYLIGIIENNKLGVAESSEILRNYFRANKGALWEDALLENGLIYRVTVLRIITANKSSQRHTKNATPLWFCHPC